MTNWLQSLETNPTAQGLYHQVSPYVNTLEAKGSTTWNNLLNDLHLETNP